MKDLRALNEAFTALAARLEQLEQLATRPTAAAAPLAPPVPSVGRIVHYGVMRNELQPYPAVIVRVYDDELQTVDLVCFSDTEEPCGLLRNVEFAAELEPGSWSWPPRV